MKFECLGQTFEKYSDIKFHENPTSGSGFVLCGQTDERKDVRRDRYDETNISFSQFCGKAPKRNRKCAYVILHYYMKFGKKNYDPDVPHSMSRTIICLVQNNIKITYFMYFVFNTRHIYLYLFVTNPPIITLYSHTTVQRWTGI